MSLVPSEKLSIETPEHTDLEFDLAGIGSRFLAFAIDSLLQFIIYLVLFIAAIFILPGMSGTWEGGSKWVVALYILIFFTLYWGYFAIFEIIWKGQTPGKRQANIRVIKSTGQPVGPFECIARNVMRAVDSLPGIYAVGLFTMFFSSRNCRLGDLVAGTVVVHESVETAAYPVWNQATPDPQEQTLEVGKLAQADLQVIETFLGRKLDLPADVREATAQKLATRFALKLELADGSWPSQRPEDFLETIARQMRGAARLF